MSTEPGGEISGFVARLTFGRRGRYNRRAITNRIPEQYQDEIALLLEQIERRSISAAQIQKLSDALNQDLDHLIGVCEREAVRAKSADALILGLSRYNLDAIEEQLAANLDAYNAMLQRTDPRMPVVRRTQPPQLTDGGAAPALDDAIEIRHTPRRSGGPSASDQTMATDQEDDEAEGALPRRDGAASDPHSDEPHAHQHQVTPTSTAAHYSEEATTQAPSTMPKLTPKQQESFAHDLTKTYDNIVHMAQHIETAISGGKAASLFALRGAIKQTGALMQFVTERRTEIQQKYWLDPPSPAQRPRSRQAPTGMRARIAIPAALLGGVLAFAALFLAWLRLAPSTRAASHDPITPWALFLLSGRWPLALGLALPAVGLVAIAAHHTTTQDITTVLRRVETIAAFALCVAGIGVLLALFTGIAPFSAAATDWPAWLYLAGLLLALGAQAALVARSPKPRRDPTERR